MTYNSRPMNGIKESFFGPAAYREAEYQQSIKPQPAQSLAVGNSNTKPTIEGFEKTIYPQSGTKQELMGAGVVAYAQAFESWTINENDKKFEAVVFTSTTTYAPEYEANKYYTESDNVYTLLTSATEPEGWGTGEFYTSDGAVEPTYTKVTFTSTTVYSPAFATNTYYKKEGNAYVLLNSQPEDWGTGTYYKEKGESE